MELATPASGSSDLSLPGWISSWQAFLDVTPKTWTTEVKINTLDFTKIKNKTLFIKGRSQRIKNVTHPMEKIKPMYLVSVAYTEHTNDSYNNNKKTNNPN